MEIDGKVFRFNRLTRLVEKVGIINQDAQERLFVVQFLRQAGR